MRPTRLLYKLLIIIMCFPFPSLIAGATVSAPRLTGIKKDTASPELPRHVVKITRTWELPPVLKEISGIAYIDSSHILCVQDEVGSVYIYNITRSVMESQIPFGPPGDYEAVALVKDVIYVACADGRLFEISGYNSAKPLVKEYGTHLTVKQNVEGLSYDAVSNVLLVAIKGQEEGNQSYKGIYSFDPVKKQMSVKPVIKINLQDPLFGKAQSKKPQSVIRPSDLAVHPISGDIYVLDGSKPQLLIMDKAGKTKALYLLRRPVFNHPEGITFSPTGECYISDGGNRQQPGRLLLVEIVN